MPIDFRGQRQAVLNAGLEDATNGYDTSQQLSDQCTYGSYDIPDQGSGSCASADLLPPVEGQTSAVGGINTRWKAGDDVWYGSAFWLPDSFFNLTSANLLGWNGAAGTYGAVGFDGSNGSLSVIRGRTGSGAETLATSDPATTGQIPHNQWVWLEVHQKFSSTDGQALTELFVNGRLVATTSSANIHSDTGTITSSSFGPTEAQSNVLTSVQMGVDRSTILSSERGALGAPPTPTGLRHNSGSITWNSVSGAGITYRLYRRNADGTWTKQGGDTSATSAPCAGNGDYRVTSVNSSGLSRTCHRHTEPAG